MKLMNPFQMNDWDIKFLIIVVIIFQALLWITIILDLIGIHIPIVRGISALISLFFLNGVLILRIFRIHGLESIKSILYSTGLSIAFIMFFGMFINLFYPFLGITRPISLMPLLITFTLFTAFLCILSYLRDRTYHNSSLMDITGCTNPILFLLLIPFLSIFGTYLVNYYQNNILLMLMFFLIAIIPFLVAFDKFLQKKLYPLAIYSISLTLLFSTSLITTYITGWDINLESYFSNLVVTNSYWNSSYPDLLNAMLSLVITVPIFSKISGLSVVSIFKVVYPALFALVPLGLFQIYKNQTNNRIAFFACFLFVSVFMFFLEMPSLARQEIGEIFFVLMIMLIIENKLSRKNLTIFTIIFIPALLVSHYSMDYVYIFLVFTAYLVYLIRNLNLPSKYNFLGKLPIINYFFVKIKQPETYKMNYKLQLILLFSISILYYFLVSSSVLLNLTLVTMYNIITISYSFLFNPKALEAVSIVTSEKSFLRTIALVLHLIIQFLIGVGILLLITRRTEMKFKENYGLFSVMSFVLLILVLTVPFLAGALNAERFYHIALILLSIFFVVGWMGIFILLNRIIGFRWKLNSVYRTSFKFLALFLAISLLFNSGVVYEIAGDNPTSMSLHSTMDGPKFNNMELLSAQWIANYKTNNMVLADSYRTLILNGYIPFNKSVAITINSYSNTSSYIYVGTYNIENDKFGLPEPGSNTIKYFKYQNTILVRNKIFDDGGSQIFL
jgi:uncharacterized membrane protein